MVDRKHEGIAQHTLRAIGAGLNRPECVLAHASGWLFCADWMGMGGVAAIAPDGTVKRISARGIDTPLRPNGIALEPDGSFLLAHLGERHGGIYRLFADGAVEPVLTAVDGVPLPPSNFVLRDQSDRIWLTVSTRKVPRAADYRPDAASGFIVLIEGGKARIVADGLGYANELALSADGDFLFVNETFGRRLTRFAVRTSGALTDPAVMARFEPGEFPDGVALDAEGGLWVTSIVSNRIIRIDPQGGRTVWLEDFDPEHLAWVEAAFRSGTMGRPHLDGAPARRLRNVSSLAFGGADLRTAYLGCLLGETIESFPTPIPGHPPAHYHYDIASLIGRLEGP